MRKKYSKRLVALFLFIGIFIILFSNFVLASIWNDVKTKTNEFFLGWQEGKLDAILAKYLFFILLILLIYSSLDFILKGKRGIKVLVAIIASFVASAYVTPSEVVGVFTSYGAMGLTLGIIIPFIILAGFTFTAIKDDSAFGLFAQEAIWWIFFAFLTLKTLVLFSPWFADLIGATVPSDITGEISIPFLVATGITLACAIFNRALVKEVRKKWFQAEKGVLESKLEKFAGAVEAVSGIGEKFERGGGI